MAQTIMSRWAYQAILIVMPIVAPIGRPEQILHQHFTLASAMSAYKVRLANRKHATGYSMQFTSIKLVVRDTN
jgi:hypothetical protein